MNRYRYEQPWFLLVFNLIIGILLVSACVFLEIVDYSITDLFYEGSLFDRVFLTVIFIGTAVVYVRLIPAVILKIKKPTYLEISNSRVKIPSLFSGKNKICSFEEIEEITISSSNYVFKGAKLKTNTKSFFINSQFLNSNSEFDEVINLIESIIKKRLNMINSC